MHRRRRCSCAIRLTKLSLVLATLLLVSATSSTLAQQNRQRDLGTGRSQHQQHGQLARRTPAKRDYDTHAYYVLELRDGSNWSEAEQLANSLGAELVEQVGELQHHWLIRAPFNDHLHKRSEGGGPYIQSADHVMDTFYELVGQAQLGFDQRQTHPVAGHRDLISNVQDASSLHAKRAFSHPRILGLERQVLKKRVKRQLDSSHIHGLMPRQEETRPKKQAQVSQYLRDIASQLGIADPLWAKQWHLANDQMQENSINVTGVWAQGVTGKGIKVAIVDDGLDMHSDDLKDNFYADGSWDYNDHTDLPEPRLSDDQHGTRCAGEIAALKNDVCGVGVAYEAQVAGIRILSASISDADEASALNFGYQENDIYSCSWGPPDDGRSMEAPSPLIYKSMLNGVQNGRGGKGSVFVFASGNGGAVDDQCNFDGYTNSIFSITISAIDRKGLHPYYSEGCSANMVVTYSSGSGDNIHTTDVGKNKCTDHHGGTSAAAPIAAGIFALALQVRPELTWRDMQYITLQTAVPVNHNDPDWQVTNAGRAYNHKYGYGKLDAYAIVEKAKTFELVNPQTWYQSEVITVDQAITEAGTKSVLTITADDVKSASFLNLEHIQVTVTAQHQRRGNMEVWLESPNGIKSILARPRRFDDDKDGLPAWTFMSVKHWDENPVGNWTLTMLDRQDNGKNGTFQDWSMMLWGQASDANFAEVYKMPQDDQIHLPAAPHHKLPTNMTVVTSTIVEDGITRTETATIPLKAAQSTKSFAKPTAHLPDNHGQATGESDHPLDATPIPSPVESTLAPSAAITSSVAAANGTAEVVGEEETSPLNYGPWSSLAGSSTWFYVAIGSVIIFLSGTVAYILIRRRKRGAGFQLVSGDDFGHPMSALERGKMRLTGQQPPTRTKALYDAFALSDSDEDEDGHEREGLVAGGSGKVDDSYMSAFLEDEDDGPSGSGRGPRSSTPNLTRYRDDEGAREDVQPRP